jgi:hypothetical protein
VVDNAAMADLSELLGDVYGGADDAPVAHEPAAADRAPTPPSWADDQHLDQAFADWTPGPSADAHPAEHEVVATSSAPLDDDLAAALSAALAAAPAHDAEIEVPAAPAPPPPPPVAAPAPAPEAFSRPDASPGDLPALENVVPATPAPVVAAAKWQPSDDDILPRGGGRRRLRLR